MKPAVSRALPRAVVAMSFVLGLCGSAVAQEWGKPSAGRAEYVQDRVRCVQEAQSMALIGTAFDRDVTDCIVAHGWQHNLHDTSMPVYCADKEAAISCKPGGTEESYKQDRATCVDQLMRTVGNRYGSPGWWGLGGLIVSAIKTQENKTNLEKSQLQYMKICLEGKNWTVQYKGAARELVDPAGKDPTPSVVQTAALATAPATLSVAQSNTSTPAAAVKVIAAESKFTFAAETNAKLAGCTQPLAAMTDKGEGSERFTVTCSSGAPLMLTCDDNGCEILK